MPADRLVVEAFVMVTSSPALLIVSAFEVPSAVEEAMAKESSVSSKPKIHSYPDGPN